MTSGDCLRKKKLGVLIWIVEKQEVFTNFFFKEMGEYIDTGC